MNKTNNELMKELLSQILLAKTISIESNQPEQEPSQVVLTYKEKYFLFRVFNTYGFDCEITEPIRLLVPNLGVSYQTIAKVKKKLSNLGIISTGKVTDGRGRPIDSFQVHSDNLKIMLGNTKDELPLIYHESMIKSLLCWGERDDDACQDLGTGLASRSERAFLVDDVHDLSAKERVFLAVLYANADKFGFVDLLGKCDIESLTGFDVDQQRRVIKKLKRNLYIRSVLPGFTNPGLFGRVHSVYCLNTGVFQDSCRVNIMLQYFLSQDSTPPRLLSANFS